jgi:trehalose 6-phosphate synthase/phosphatase
MDIKSQSVIREKFREAENRLVLLDYDGTLVGYEAIPDKAKLPVEIKEIIKKLLNDRQTTVYIITGRGYKDIDRFLNGVPVNIIAEHGAMLKDDGIWKNQINENVKWKESFFPVLDRITTACPGSFVEVKKFSLAWHYRNAEPETGLKYSRELIDILSKIINSFNLRIMDGNKVVEILTNETGKGSAVKRLCDKNSFDFALSIGDDVTDEDMFEFLLHYPNAYTIKVGDGATNARYKINSTNEVVSLLKQLAG